MVKFDVSVIGTATSEQATLLQKDLLYAASRWSRYLVGDTTLQVQINVIELQEDVLAWGTSAVAAHTGDAKGVEIYQQGAVLKLTGQGDANGSDPDILIKIAADELGGTLWLDPAPQANGSVPFGKIDVVSVLEHELGHAFSFNGWSDQQTGRTSGSETPWDYWLSMLNQRPFFNGPTATAAYGGPIPLTIGNLLHYGNWLGAGSDINQALMSGTGTPASIRQDVSDLDLAILKDSGVPLNIIFGGVGDDTLVGSSLAGLDGNDSLSGTDVADQILSGRGDDRVGSGAGDDTVRGDDGNDIMNGNMGFDTIDGGAGNDWLFGGRGYDLLLGGSGNDTLSGDRGNDTVDGGAGNDVFDFRNGGGFDQIDKFELGDRIELAAGTFFTVQTFSEHVEIDYAGGSITLTQTNTFKPEWLIYG
jgi:Ca2+-binding RTX toxin-like protein